MNNVKKILQFFTQFPLTNNGNFSIFTYVNNKTRGNKYESFLCNTHLEQRPQQICI